jgi:hypothetical protein
VGRAIVLARTLIFKALGVFANHTHTQWTRGAILNACFSSFNIRMCTYKVVPSVSPLYDLLSVFTHFRCVRPVPVAFVWHKVKLFIHAQSVGTICGCETCVPNGTMHNIFYQIIYFPINITQDTLARIQ